ncbi:glycosyltransferase 87 family protein [Actomonas aquatica]|uniref:DUF2029 domain-containing protein n=1 Tax=Actomonas aquatica TaxID=2866162 RepID=A0ABZ1C6H9_9BACT|nr:glycosyltransferase 87 family protein [Opitutus sp. WL0086]WRQ86932.1 hypothetical protein K1X11_019130 [Opitutus sp. WL0086]
MTKPAGRDAVLWAAGGLVAGAVAWLAWRAEAPDARSWLAVVHAVGWLAIGAVVWRGRESRRAWWIVAGLGLLFRLLGVGTAPSWEDDYHRYLWDGYVTVTKGDPYAEPPLAGFQAEREVPEAVAEALDGINNPDIPTIYGPVSQGLFAGAAWLVPGSFLTLKLGLILVEMLGWIVLRRHLRWSAWVLVWWCPLAVTEIGFAGHPEALGVGLTAIALAAWGEGRGGRSALAMAAATAVKPFGAVLAPFLAWRFGWRAVVVGLGGWMLCYLPFWLQGSVGEWPAVRAMSQTFEYNSTGFAVLAGVMPDAVARRVAGLLAVVAAMLFFWRWSRGDRAALPPGAAILGVALLLSPVVNPWYALWLLPWLALRPTGWGVGVLIAVPLAYTHGWGGTMGAGVDYTHPWWTRPLEVVVVIGGAVAFKKLKS